MERTQAQPRMGRAGALAALAIAAITLGQLWLVLAVLEPRAFFSSDAGVKYLQAHGLAISGWHSLAVHVPGEAIDPPGRFSILAGNQFERAADDAPFYGAYSPLFTLPVSVLLALAGMRGLYLVPIFATAATMWITYRLARRSAGRSAWLAPVLVGACSPMLFYSVDLWEHTLAVLLTTIASALVVTHSERGDGRGFALAGAALGLALNLREELFAMLPAGLIVLAWVPRGRLHIAAGAAAAGVAATLLPLLALRTSTSGMPTRAPLLRVFGIKPAYDTTAAPLWGIGAELLVPASLLAVGGLAALLIVRGAAARSRARRRELLLSALAGGAALWAVIDAVVLIRTWQRPESLIGAFPALLALLFFAPRQPDSRSRRDVGQLLMIVAVFLLGVWATVGIAVSVPGGAQWGPRYLLPAVPLLAVAIASAVDRRGEWGGRRAPRAVAAGAAVLVLASLLVQLQGVRDLRVAKAGYERLLRATEAVAPGGLIVTNLGWFGAVTAVVATGRPMLLFDGQRTGSLAELLRALPPSEPNSLTLVRAVPGDDAADEMLARNGWHRRDRTLVRLWLDLEFVDYERARPRSSTTAMPAQSKAG